MWRTGSPGAGRRRKTGSLAALRLLARVHGAVCVRAVLVQHTFIQIHVPAARGCMLYRYRRQDGTGQEEVGPAKAGTIAELPMREGRSGVWGCMG